MALAGMTVEERIPAYGRRFTRAELFGAARVRPDLMPLLNGELEWIAVLAE